MPGPTTLGLLALGAALALGCRRRARWSRDGREARISPKNGPDGRFFKNVAPPGAKFFKKIMPKGKIGVATGCVCGRM